MISHPAVDVRAVKRSLNAGDRGILDMAKRDNVQMRLFTTNDGRGGRRNNIVWVSQGLRDVGGTVASESALRPFCRGFEPRHQRPGLTEGLKA
ncbi:hypothetical protein PoB_006419600 [Plakobranchus ocellatus]|uniref:Uncharacterized protein n=1 Tax=Plakobranchus ocellatus TaxID=259542 RepID=A0AAV4D0F0_9GAST|nr:hypothetical protein PoB_006419600 [Plakobranchus ocellatus]